MTTKAASPPSGILWAKVWGLAAVQGAIILTWVIYNLYLVTLLTGLGFPEPLAVTLLVIENILAAVMEPLMGSLSDRVQHWMGSQFPLIALGIVLSSGCFIAIPAVAIFGAGARWLLPTMLVAWALAMTLFRAPALSLLGRYAFQTQLPQAASILTLVGGIAGAVGPMANRWILSLGPGLTFAIGSFVLIGAAFALRSANPTAGFTPKDSGDPASASPVSWLALGFIFGTGFGVALGFRCLMTGFPALVTAQLPEGPQGLIVGLIFIAIALVAIPGGQLATRLGNRRTMILGLALMGILGLLAGAIASGVLLALFALSFGACFSMVSNGTIPYALSLVPSQKAGLGTGMYFSGGAVASALFGTFADTVSGLSPALILAAGSLFFGLAALCIASSPRLKLGRVIH
ncbi:MAG: MFS transporter [Cyanobacteria bacterium P01_D01_bin.128]